MKRTLEEHVAGVYRFSLRLAGDPHDAEDLTQEVMVRAWRSRAEIRDEGALRTWLFRIAVNLWRDTVRHRGRLQVIATDDPAAEDGGPPPHSAVVHQEDQQRVMAALDALPRRQRDVMYLHVCEGLTLSEVGDVLDISYTAVKANLSAGRKRMRSRLKDLYEESNGAVQER